MAQQNPAQARARIEAMKRQFEQKRQIEDSLSGIRNKIGVYSGKGEYKKAKKYFLRSLKINESLEMMESMGY